MSDADTTSVVGYYNPNRWPIRLEISRFNIALHLEPNQFILDKRGRKINDPFFEAYATTKQLARETSKTPVPLILIPLPSNPIAQNIPDGQSVRVVTEFKTDASGQRVPVIPPPKSFPEQALNKQPVTTMSIEQARKLGLVQKTREVPEDYGAPDNDGTPPRKLPQIRYATDLRPTKPQPLPPQVMESVPKGREGLLAQLHQATAAPVEASNAAVFMNTVTPTAPPDSPLVAGPAPAPESMLPTPALDEAVPVPEPPVEEEEEPGQEEGLAQAVPLSQPPRPTLPPRPPTAKDKYVCVGCGKGFPFRSQLERHASSVHRSDYEAVMAPYPEVR